MLPQCVLVPLLVTALGLCTQLHTWSRPPSGPLSSERRHESPVLTPGYLHFPDPPLEGELLLLGHRATSLEVQFNAVTPSLHKKHHRHLTLFATLYTRVWREGVPSGFHASMHTHCGHATDASGVNWGVSDSSEVLIAGGCFQSQLHTGRKKGCDLRMAAEHIASLSYPRFTRDFFGVGEYTIHQWMISFYPPPTTESDLFTSSSPPIETI